MPNWVVNILLPYVVPILVQALSPIIVEYLKKAADYVHGKLPAAATIVLAGVVSEGVNQGLAYVSGASLPPGVGAIVTIFLNELGNDFGKQPPTPGVA
jgi:hypothetical protein